MGVEYEKWVSLTIHADDNSNTKYTTGTVVGYRLVRLMDGRDVKSDKQGKYGTTVKGILKRSGSLVTLFMIKEGLVTSNDEVTGEYDLIGVGLTLVNSVTALIRNGTSNNAYGVDISNYSKSIADESTVCVNNCTLQLSGGLYDIYDSNGNIIPNIILNSLS